MDTSAFSEARRIRWSATAGMIAPLWFWITLAGLAVLHGTIEVSGHQLLSFGFLMSIGFFVYGALTLIFVAGLRRRMPVRRRSSAATLTLVLFACGPLLATFTTDPSGAAEQSWHGWIHFAGFLLFSLMPIVATLLFGLALWRDADWNPLGPVSLAWAGVIALVVFLPPAPVDAYPLWSGPASMAEIALIGVWQILISVRLARLATPDLAPVDGVPARQRGMGRTIE